MSEVTLRIGGRSYNVACQDGEEAHILHLGAMIDAKIEAMGTNRAPQESQNLLFAALFLADELHDTKSAANRSEATLFDAEDGKDLRGRIENLEAEREALLSQVAELQAEADTAPPEHSAPDFNALLEEVAGKLEKCADALESGAAAS